MADAPDQALGLRVRFFVFPDEFVDGSLRIGIVSNLLGEKIKLDWIFALKLGGNSYPFVQLFRHRYYVDI